MVGLHLLLVDLLIGDELLSHNRLLADLQEEFAPGGQLVPVDENSVNAATQWYDMIFCCCFVDSEQQN